VSHYHKRNDSSDKIVLDPMYNPYNLWLDFLNKHDHVGFLKHFQKKSYQNRMTSEQLHDCEEYQKLKKNTNLLVGYTTFKKILRGFELYFGATKMDTCSQCDEFEV